MEHCAATVGLSELRAFAAGRDQGLCGVLHRELRCMLLARVCASTYSVLQDPDFYHDDEIYEGIKALEAVRRNIEAMGLI